MRRAPSQFPPFGQGIGTGLTVRQGAIAARPFLLSVPAYWNSWPPTAKNWVERRQIALLSYAIGARPHWPCQKLHITRHPARTLASQGGPFWSSHTTMTIESADQSPFSPSVGVCLRIKDVISSAPRCCGPKDRSLSCRQRCVHGNQPAPFCAVGRRTNRRL